MTAGRIYYVIIWGAITGALAFGQEFEVASVKHSAADSKAEACLCEPMGRLAYRSAPLDWIIERAYRMQTPQILGPAWLLTESFDIDAKLPEGASAAEVPAMLRELLAKRFQFAAHAEQREVSGFALVIGKGGSKLAPPQDGWDASWRQNKTGIHLRQRMSMEDLAYYLSTQVEKPVVNETGLQGTFAVTLDFGPLTLSASKKINAAPPLPAALEEQLGLKLEAGKRPTEVLVIDRVAKVPTEN